MLTPMFERFSDRARRVLVLAQEEARLLNHNFIGTEHILLGLIHEGDGVAAKALESLGIRLETVREKVEETISPAGSSITGAPPFTPRAKKVLEFSLREAIDLGHNYIGTEHMLLGLVREGEGVAAQVLVGLGADLPRVRERVISVLSGEDVSPGDDGGPRSTGVQRSGPMSPGWVSEHGVVRGTMGASEVCSLCGRDLWEVERFVTAGGVKVCEQCVAAAGEVLRAAQIDGRGPELQLPPRAFGEAPDDHAIDEIVTAFQQLFSGTVSDAERATFLEDAEVLRPHLEEAVRRILPRLMGCQVEHVGFFAADQARVRFILTLTQGGTLQIDGTAVQREGQWKVSRDTQVDLLRRIGFDIPPFAE